MNIPPLRSPQQRQLAAATGATARSTDPIAKQAIERVKSGQLPVSDFHKLYKGNIRSGVLAGKVKHAPRHGFSRWKTTDQYMKTLAE